MYIDVFGNGVVGVVLKGLPALKILSNLETTILQLFALMFFAFMCLSFKFFFFCYLGFLFFFFFFFLIANLV